MGNPEAEGILQHRKPRRLTWIYEEMDSDFPVWFHWRLKRQWNDPKHTLPAAAPWDLPCECNRLGMSGASYRT